MDIAPNALRTQPMAALAPSGARLTGKRKMPAPIIVPMTTELASQCRWFAPASGAPMGMAPAWLSASSA